MHTICLHSPRVGPLMLDLHSNLAVTLPFYLDWSSRPEPTIKVERRWVPFTQEQISTGMSGVCRTHECIARDIYLGMDTVMIHHQSAAKTKLPAQTPATSIFTTSGPLSLIDSHKNSRSKQHAIGKILQNVLTAKGESP